MSDLRPKPRKIELGGKEFGLLFSINAIDDIQDHFDIPIASLIDLLRDERKIFKNLRYLLTVLINEAIDDEENGQPHVEERWVGRKITPENIHGLSESILQAFSEGSPEVEDEEIPNVKSE